MSFRGTSPMEFIDSEQLDDQGVEPEIPERMRAIPNTVRAYLKAAEELLAGKYKHLAGLAPEYLSNPGNVLVAMCADGLVIRYEKKVEKRRSLFAVMPEGLAQVVSLLSQNVVRLLPDRTKEAESGAPPGIDIRLAVVNSTNNSSREILAAKMCFDVVVTRPLDLTKPPQKPYCLLSVRNNWEWEIHGEMMPAEGSGGTGEPFVARTPMRLPVGWDCIEVYPYVDPEHWKPEFAPIWAENDILAAVIFQKGREEHYASLDRRAEVRKEYAQLLKEFKALLDSDPEREQTLQDFLQSNPKLLSPAHTRMWPKLSLGTRVTDFVFRDATQDYLLVELERSNLRLFRQDGHVTAELTHAQGQVVDWKRYLEDNLTTVQRELGLVGISSHPKSLIVMGRTSSLTGDNRRKLVAMQNENPKLRIMTYDDVYENAKAVIENLLGPTWDAGGITQIYYLSEK